MVTALTARAKGQGHFYIESTVELNCSDPRMFLRNKSVNNLMGPEYQCPAVCAGRRCAVYVRVSRENENR